MLYIIIIVIGAYALRPTRIYCAPTPDLRSVQAPLRDPPLALSSAETPVYQGSGIAWSPFPGQAPPKPYPLLADERSTLSKDMDRGLPSFAAESPHPGIQ